MGKVALRLSLGFLLVALACARIPRNEVERQKDEERLRRQQDSGISTYYLLVKPEPDGKNDRTRSEALAADFLTRLGNDKHVTIAAASKDKLVIKIKGDDAFANKIVDAAKSFPETALLEKKPLYRTLGGHSGRRGRKPSVEKPEMATM
mmetsp:Transcript_87961/g.142359  ORF Transcript_87961/g.142359 Transcript_87961/m.142359 type:complete len:149 (+) Transcript_87961:14-460(+)